MAQNQFDVLSRSLETGSRRQALRAIGALGIAGLLDQVVLTGAAARKKKRKAKARAKGACPAPTSCPECPNS